MSTYFKESKTWFTQQIGYTRLGDSKTVVDADTNVYDQVFYVHTFAGRQSNSSVYFIFS